MIDFISGLLGQVIYFIYNVCGHSYLIALILFTLLTKLLLFPLMLKQLKSTKDLQKIAPEDKRIREKYKDNPQKLNEELAKLYQENKVSPMGGCLMPLIQIPLVLAMFWVVKQPLTYVAHIDQDTIKNKTAEYLNVSVDEVTESMMKQYEIDIAKKYELLDMSITNNVNLGDTPKNAFSKDETKKVNIITLIIPILTFITSWLSTKVMQRKQAQNMSDEQVEMQKSMNLVMPILSTYISFTWPISLGLYWLLGNIFSIAQQFVLDKLMDDEKQDNTKKIKEKKEKVLFLGKGENND